MDRADIPITFFVHGSRQGSCREAGKVVGLLVKEHLRSFAAGQTNAVNSVAEKPSARLLVMFGVC